MVKKILFFFILFSVNIILGQKPTNGIIANYEFTNGVIGLGRQGNNGSFIDDRLGQVNSAFNLNGDKLGRSDLNYSGNEATISFWVKTNTNESAVKTIYEDASNRNNPNNDSFGSWTGHYFYLKNGKIGYVLRHSYRKNLVGSQDFLLQRRESNQQISDGGWHHVAVTIKQEAIPKNAFVQGRQIIEYVTTAILYIDGSQSVTSTVSKSTAYGQGGNWHPEGAFAGNVYVGRNRNDNLSQTNRYTDGFDDLIVYNRELSSAEVLSVTLDKSYCLPISTSNFNITNITTSQATLDLMNPDVYDIAYHKSTETFNDAVIVSGVDRSTGNNTLYDITGLDLITDYLVYIRNQGCNIWSPAKMFKTLRNPTPFYVNANATSNGTGVSWSDPYNNLTDALNDVINSSQSNPEIWIAKGTYKPHVSDRNVSFQLTKSGVRIYGGFAGNETSLSDRDISLIHTTNETILSGDLQDNDDNNISFNNATRADNSLRIVNITTEDIEINGVTISGGYADAASGDGRFGAGLSVDQTSSNFVIKNSIIKNNVAFWAAGLSLSGQTTSTKVKIEASIFENNLTSNGASAFYVVATQSQAVIDFTLVNSLFRNNKTMDDGARKANGLSAGWVRSYTSGAQINSTIVNNTFVNNVNEGTGTSDFATLGISQQSGSYGQLNISNNIFWENSNNNGSIALAIGKGPDTNLANGIEIVNSIDENNFSNITNKTNTSNSDPLFTDAPNNDFTLQAGSPAVNTGDNTKIPSSIVVDLLGKVRIHNTTVDMGAYEFGAGNYLPRTLSIAATNGSVTTNPNLTTGGVYNDGTSVELTATPDVGYQFDGWSGDATGTTNPLTITMDADKTVTAMFSKIQRALTINATNGSVSTNPNPTNGTYDDGTDVTLTATPAAGYQ
ncbi:InlB B-repeat-containing protein, partial [Tenacibaculum amylolyticum]|uniref:InlB B-repeat-containing protein n=1 Tax=Tenacibaculum amylolyticum TaxID=104269 RepID=UPI0038B45284